MLKTFHILVAVFEAKKRQLDSRLDIYTFKHKNKFLYEKKVQSVTVKKVRKHLLPSGTVQMGAVFEKVKRNMNGFKNVFLVLYYLDETIKKRALNNRGKKNLQKIINFFLLVMSIYFFI